MTTSIEAEKLEEPEFAWGKKRGVGGKNKEVQFYETFTYDGEEYALYDNVFMYKEDEPEPYIGKLIKIWGKSDNTKKVKVQWFFRPREISPYLRNGAAMENELFFASGEGNGQSNICHLEAIAGKCNILCISKDDRNPQVSFEELQRYHYVFYRIFDVKSCTISDHMDDKVGGIEAKYVFNRAESLGAPDAHNPDLTHKDEKKMIACGETPKAAGENSLNILNNVKPKENSNHMLGKECTNVKETAVKEGSLHGDSTGLCVKSSEIQVKLEGGVTKDAKDFGGSDGAKSKREKLDGTMALLEGNNMKSVQSLSKDATHTVKRKLTRSFDLTKEKSNTQNDADRENSDTNLAKDSPPEGPPTKKGKNDDYVKMLEDPKNNNVEKTNEKIYPEEIHESSLVPKLKLGNGVSKEDLEGGFTKKGNIDDYAKLSKACKTNANEKNYPNEIKDSLRLANNENTEKLKFGEGDMSEHYSDKSGNTSKSKLSISAIKARDGDVKVESRIFEVTPKPIVEKSNWMKLSWDSKLKAAHDKGTLILLQNLDPDYTSGEVEDIVYHAFKEECEAKTVQHTATSNPYSGQAFVMLKSRETVDRVLKRLDDGCLLLPNQRPLVARLLDFPKVLGKQTLVGHLAIDKYRRQSQTTTREAVATSHYSQTNTIEYEMAMAWCLLQSRSDKWWKLLYKQHMREMQKLADNLKSKTKSGK